MNASGRNWLIPRKDDRMNFWFWRLSPWLAGIEWLVILAGSVLTPTCGSQNVAAFLVIVTMATILFFVGLRAMTWGGASRLGAIILAVTNGLLLLDLAVSVAAQWWSLRH